MITSLYDLVEKRITEAERERKQSLDHVKLLTKEIRELKIVLSTHRNTVRTLPKGSPTQEQKEGRKSAANGEPAKHAERNST